MFSTVMSAIDRSGLVTAGTASKNFISDQVLCNQKTWSGLNIVAATVCRWQDVLTTFLRQSVNLQSAFALVATLSVIGRSCTWLALLVKAIRNIVCNQNA